MSLSLQTSEENIDESVKQKKFGFRGDMLLIGVLLPIFTLVFEFITGICSDVYIDPIPTLFHILLVGFVPLANTYLFWCLWKERFERVTLFGWASVIAAGVGVFYSLVFLPASPISLIGIILYGLGFLGLSPMFALLATFLMRKRFRNVTKNRSFIFNWRGTLVGFLIVFAIIAVSESRFLITKHGLEKAASENVTEQKEGLELLRKYGNESYLSKLSNSYRNTFYLSDSLYSLLFRSSNGSSSEKAGEIYYRSNGKVAESDQTPSRFGFGETINNDWRNRHISLISSEMDGSIDNDASLGYLEWVFEFQNNDQNSQGEAIGQIQLPPDAVVSRLTLWIDGEEREAAYAERSRVTQAYEGVVRLKLDPVLVTTSGKDRVDMKCFPIQPKGGTMKVKIGITFPLILEKKQNGLLQLPYFRGENFKIADGFKHKISILGTDELTSNDKSFASATEDRFIVMRGNVANEDIENLHSTINASRDEEKTAVWANYDDSYIKQEIIEKTSAKASRFVFVIDTSVGMKELQPTIIKAIESLPNDAEIGLVLTHGNALNTDISYPNSFVGKRSEIAEKLKQTEFGGGTDNLPALTKAWDLANEAGEGVVIWIHAPQPFKFNNSENEAKKLVRKSNKTEIYNLSISNGTDVIENELTDLDYLKNVKRFGDIRSDLIRLVSQLGQTTKVLKYARTIDTEARETVDKKTSKHMIRLWAYDEINEILATEKDERSAINLAMKYQLVTPVTGAVVLETQEQFDQAGLKPTTNKVAHAVPEPETYVLMFIGLLMIMWFSRKQIL